MCETRVSSCSNETIKNTITKAFKLPQNYFTAEFNYAFNNLRQCTKTMIIVMILIVSAAMIRSFHTATFFSLKEKTYFFFSTTEGIKEFEWVFLSFA